MLENLFTPMRLIILQMSEKSYIYSISPRSRGLSAEEYMLRKSGDWRGYLEMMNSGSIESIPFFRALVNYYASGIKSFEDIKPEDNGLLIATSVWGDKYLGRFLTLCLPSLLEEKNLCALKKKKARIFIHTDLHGQKILSNHPLIGEFIKEGIIVQLMLLNEDVIEMMETIPHAKYWHLGMTQSMHLQYAKALHVDYHLMMPDIVYSAGYFDRLFKIGKFAITHGCISSYEGTLNLENYRRGITLAIPPKDLMTLSIIHSHKRANQHFMSSNKKLPRSHLVVIEGKDEVHIMSPHQSIAYMSKKLIAQIPDRIFFTLDSELEKIFSDTPIYTPSADDGLVMSEVSADVECYERKECKDEKEFCISKVRTNGR